ncbi:hypothetical protein [Arvimicrobium flavum]|uniref:hypothetical protein n=1 Tax=Arvimicrobium flavum TaxID=3393320 RepID=UPI00237AE321|nr:hypothetical protein [Mesorhizobium shangrilense]
MAARALVDLLPDFGSKPASVAAAVVQTMRAPPEPTVKPEMDVASIVAAEVAIVEARVRSEMSAASEAALEAARAHHSSELADLRASLSAAAGASIAAAMETAEARLSTLASGAVARILSSFLGDDLARRSVEQLAARIRAALADREAVRLKVSGPPSLFEALGAALGPLADQCDFSETSGFDLTVAIDDTLFETRLGEWSATIGEALP